MSVHRNQDLNTRSTKPSPNLSQPRWPSQIPPHRKIFSLAYCLHRGITGEGPPSMPGQMRSYWYLQGLWDDIIADSFSPSLEFFGTMVPFLKYCWIGSLLYFVYLLGLCSLWFVIFPLFLFFDCFVLCESSQWETIICFVFKEKVNCFINCDGLTEFPVLALLEDTVF